MSLARVVAMFPMAFPRQLGTITTRLGMGDPADPTFYNLEEVP